MASQIKAEVVIDTEELFLTYDGDEDYAEGGPLAHAIVRAGIEQLIKDIRPELRRKIESQVLATIVEEAGQLAGHLVEQAFLEEVQQTNEWGQPRGETKTLRDILVERATVHLSEKVDERDGEVNSYSGRNTITRRQYLIQQATKSIIAEAIAPELERIRTEIKAQIQGQIGQKLESVVREIFGIKA